MPSDEERDRWREEWMAEHRADPLPRAKEEEPEDDEDEEEEDEDIERLESARLAGDARPRWQPTRKPDPPLDSGVAVALDSLGVDSKNTEAGPAAVSGPAVCSSDRDEVKRQHKVTTTDKAICQGKINKWDEITARRPAYSINEKIGNAYIGKLKRELTLNECNLLGLLNSLMQRYGYAFPSYEQLAHWLRMKPEGIRTMMRRLRKVGLVTDVSKVYGKHRWVVCSELQNRKKRGSDDPPF